jgi:Peptidase A4 family
LEIVAQYKLSRTEIQRTLWCNLLRRKIAIAIYVVELAVLALLFRTVDNVVGFLIATALLTLGLAVLTTIAIAVNIGRHPDLLAPSVYRFTEEGFERQSPAPRSHAWTDVRSARETAFAFLFSVARRRVVIIAKRGFSTDHELVALRSIVDAHVARSVLAERGRRRPTITTVVVVASFTALLAFVWSGPRQVQHFAGYLWCCGANQVAATFTVPVVRNPPPGGLGALWIGVQSSLEGSSDPFFLQAGITFGNYYSAPQYTLFWSDPARHFLPQPLGSTNPGDRVRFSLREIGPRWVISYDDLTTDLSNSLSLYLPTQTSGDVVEFFEEDPQSTGGIVPSGVIPMVRVHSIVTGLEVDGQPPPPPQMSAQQFVDATGTTYYPSPYRDDRFALLHRR